HRDAALAAGRGRFAPPRSDAADTADLTLVNEAHPPSLTSRLLLGGIAGFAATVAMTSVMARLHRRLPERERYPLPPREITEQLTGGTDEQVRDRTMAAHFLYGGLCGAAMIALRPKP